MDSNNYRGVTLLTCIGKLFTSVLNERFKVYCESNKINNENQAGFRANHSTMNHIFSLKALMDLMFKSKQKLHCAFVDYEKAFDTVWRDGLWYKLHMLVGLSDPKFPPRFEAVDIVFFLC